MNKYKCTVCGYIYDTIAGDSTQGIKPGTAFEDLPDSWVCPECGVGKEMFEKCQGFNSHKQSSVSRKIDLCRPSDSISQVLIEGR